MHNLNSISIADMEEVIIVQESLKRKKELQPSTQIKLKYTKPHPSNLRNCTLSNARDHLNAGSSFFEPERSYNFNSLTILALGKSNSHYLFHLHLSNEKANQSTERPNYDEHMKKNCLNFFAVDPRLVSDLQ